MDDTKATLVRGERQAKWALRRYTLPEKDNPGIESKVPKKEDFT